MQPEKRDIALQLLREGVNEFGTKCTQERLDKVKEVMLKRADDAVKQNSYWKNFLQSWHQYGTDTHTDYKALIEAQTPEKVAAFVKKVVSSGNHVTVMMLPEE